MSTNGATTTKPEAELPASVIHTGSISSSVDLDFVNLVAHKVYHPSLPVRLLYRLTFQAPFPYVANHAALEAARQRRIIVDLLTKYWFGHHLVARVIEIDDTSDGAHDFVTQLVKGKEPPHQKGTLDFMRRLDRKFLEAGLPTWQVTPYNPHAITNFILTPEGTYRIIDLESSLVAFLYPLSGLLRLMRHGVFPSFDDIDICHLRLYVHRHGYEIEAKLGPEYSLLVDAVSAYQAAAEEWHTAEPRILNKAFQYVANRLPFRYRP